MILNENQDGICSRTEIMADPINDMFVGSSILKTLKPYSSRFGAIIEQDTKR
jgi:hypothetical protein